jgi:hypothetical protein
MFYDKLVELCKKKDFAVKSMRVYGLSMHSTDGKNQWSAKQNVKLLPFIGVAVPKTL